MANTDRNKIIINIGRLYSIRSVSQIRKMYDQLNFYEEADNPDLVDNSGYLGLFYREKKALISLTE